jgi:hypothetical protein
MKLVGKDRIFDFGFFAVVCFFKVLKRAPPFRMFDSGFILISDFGISISELFLFRISSATWRIDFGF